MIVETEVQRIKALICPQRLVDGDVTHSGLNEVTVDIARRNLDAILANDASEPAHTSWLNAEHSYPEQLWAMLRQDFPANLSGFEYTPEESA